MAKVKSLTDKEIKEFMNIYSNQDKMAIKKFSALKLVKFINFLRHYEIELSNGQNKTREHSNDEINQSLFALFLIK